MHLVKKILENKNIITQIITKVNNGSWMKTILLAKNSTVEDVFLDTFFLHNFIAHITAIDMTS